MIYDPDCTRCRLHKKARTVCVPGAPSALLRLPAGQAAVVLGEAPGEAEDAAGEPFVGESGQLLRAAIAETGLLNVLYTNTVKCRPPENRDPTRLEVQRCSVYLKRELRRLQPAALLCVGAVAMRAAGVAGLVRGARGKLFFYGRIPTMVAWHPAYVLRDERRMDEWKDDLATFAILAQVERGDLSATMSA